MAGESFFVPAWTVDAKALLDARAEVHASCSRCKRWDLVDLERVITKHGPRFSFWNRRPPCPKCKPDRLSFLAGRPGAGVWLTRMFDLPQAHVDRIHDRWRASWPRERRDCLPVRPLMWAVNGMLDVGCDCDVHPGFRLNADEVRAWCSTRGRELTTTELVEIFRQSCPERACRLDAVLVEGNADGRL